jgi:hypothetical protein
MTDHAIPRSLTWAWDQQRIGSITANRLKQRLDRARTAALVLALAAAVLAVAATQLAGPARGIGQAAGVAAAISAGFATLVQRQVGTDPIRIWTRARSASERLKAEVYSYLAGGSPYTNATDRDTVLGNRTRSLVNDVADLQRHTLGISSDDKPLPAAAGIDDYIAKRVNDQIHSFYRPKAALYEQRVRRLRTLGTALGVVIVVLSAFAAANGFSALAAWVPVATTAGTSVVAHVAAARYDHLIIECLHTAQRLEHLRDTPRHTSSTNAQYIDDCEDVISVENQGWMARWNTEQHGDAAKSP